MNNKRIFALGFFDGVHMGHQALLRECCSLAAQQGCEPAAITFDRHPQALFSENPPDLISTPADRQRLLRQFGVGSICSYPVTEEVMSTTWRAFLEQLRQLGAAGFVCGYDFRFGHRGEGNAEKVRDYCQEHALPCIVVPEQELDGIRVSSTHIRGLLERGDMEEANRFLGHPHILSGKVTSGRRLGRTLGIPTANLRIPDGIACPAYGVYACRVQVEGESYSAVTNVGMRPTVGGHHVTVESWILDFEGDLYGKEITVSFHRYLRPERKFDSLEELQGEIRKNSLQTREFFKNF